LFSNWPQQDMFVRAVFALRHDLPRIDEQIDSFATPFNHHRSCGALNGRTPQNI